MGNEPSTAQNSLEKDSEPKGNVVVQKGAWVVMIVVWLCGVAMAIAQYKVSGVMIPMQEDLGIDSARAGLVQGVFTVLGIFLAFPAVVIIRKLGVKRGFILAISVTLIGGIVGYFSTGFASMIVSRIIEGFGLGLIGIIGPSVIAMWFPIEKRGAPMGLWSCWQMVGISICFYASTPLTASFNTWRSLWILGVAGLVIALILTIIFVKEPPKGQNYADVQDEGVKITRVLKCKDAWLVGLAALAFGLSNSVVISWIAPYWISTGIEAAVAINMTGALFTIECFGTIIAGIILNKVRRRRKFIVVDSILYAVVFFFIFRTTGFKGAIVMMILYAIIESGFCCAMWTLVGQTVPDPRLAPGAMALYTIFIDIGMWLGPTFAGGIIDTAGWGSVAIFVCVAQLLAALFWGILKLYNEKGEVVKI